MPFDQPALAARKFELADKMATNPAYQSAPVFVSSPPAEEDDPQPVKPVKLSAATGQRRRIRFRDSRSGLVIVLFSSPGHPLS